MVFVQVEIKYSSYCWLTVILVDNITLTHLQPVLLFAEFATS